MDGKVALENCLLVSIFAHNGMESDTHLVCNITISKRTSQNNLILFSNESQKISHSDNLCCILHMANSLQTREWPW
jgi:hypothetical protein